MKIKHVVIVADDENVIGELCAGGRELGEKVTAVVFGSEDLGKTALSLGADEALVCPSGMPENYAKVIAKKAEESNLVLLGSNVRARLLAGKIATYLGTCVTSGVSTLVGEDGLTTTRMVYGGAAIRTEKLTGVTPVVTLAVGVFSAADADTSRTGTVTVLDAVESVGIKQVEVREKKEAAVNLATARCIIDMGRGFAKEEDLEMGRKLASALGGDVGCSRPVAEGNGWMPRARYIGVTGVMIKPDLCLTIGVSGQVQHLVGIADSKTVVSINKDKDAPIFKHSDFGVVGDMYKILPALIEKLG